MIAYLCDSCGLPLSGNNGEAIFLTLFTKENKEYKVKITPELDHYHQDCVIKDLCVGSRKPAVEERKQFFPLGEWKTDSGAKVNLYQYDPKLDMYLGKDSKGFDYDFNGRGYSDFVGKLKTKRRSEEEEW